MKFYFCQSFLWILYLPILLMNCQGGDSQLDSSISSSEHKFAIGDCSIDRLNINFHKIDSIVDNKLEIISIRKLLQVSYLNQEEKRYLIPIIIKNQLGRDEFKIASVNKLLDSLSDSIRTSIFCREIYYHTAEYINNKKGILTFDKDSIAIVYYKKALEGYESTKGASCLDELKCLNKIWYIEKWHRYNDRKAIPFLKKEELLFDGLPLTDSLKYPNYYTQASIYRKLKNYDVSLNYINLAIRSIVQEEPIDSNKLISCYANRGNVKMNMKLLNSSIEDYKKIILWGQQLKLSDARMFNYYSGLITVNNKAMVFDNFEENIEGIQKYAKNDNFKLGMIFKLKGNYCHKMKDFKNAIKDYEKAMLLLEPYLPKKNHYYNEASYLLSIIYLHEKDYDKALKYIKIALSRYLKNDIINVEEIIEDENAIRYLGNIAKIYSLKYKTTLDPKYDILASKYYDSFHQLIDFYNQYDDDEVVIVNQSLLRIHLAYYFEFVLWKYKKKPERQLMNKLFEIVNLYKAQSLQRNLFKMEENETLARLQQKKFANNRHLEELRFFISDNVNYIDSMILIEKGYLSIKDRLDDSITLVKNSSPPKQQISLKERAISYAEKEQSVIVDYFIPEVDQNAYLLISDSNGARVIKIDSTKRLIQITNEYHQALQLNKVKEIQKYGTSLYKSLVNEIKPFLTKKIKKLVIIPDHNLRGIPFGSLKDYSKETNTFLIEDIAIDYGFSLDSYIRNRSNTGYKKEKVLVYAYSSLATIFEKSVGGLSELPGSYKEMKAIEEVYSTECTTFDGLSSTKRSFLTQARDYSMIHLALHGRADTSSRYKSCIYFRHNDRSDPLYPYELIDENIQPELLFLSACESAKGKNYSQEGMFSIARAFYQAGCKSVVSSIWDLDDESGSQIVKFFYQIKKSNPTYSFTTCLQYAKIKYLRQNSLSQISPSYWSSLVLYK